MKYPNPLTKYRSGGFELLELDSFMEFYFEFSDGLKVLPVQAGNIWGIISEGNSWVSELGRYSEDGRKVTIGVEELNQRVVEVREISGVDIPLCEGEELSDFVKLTLSVVSLDIYIPGGILKYVDEWSRERISAVVAKLENGLLNGDLERADWEELVDLTSSFYYEVMKIFYIHRDFQSDFKHLEKIFRNRGLRYINGEYNYKKISSAIKKELGREVVYGILPLARMIDLLLAKNASQDKEKIISTLEVGGDLEDRVAALYKSLGYEVVFTPSTRDFGVDILAKSNNGVVGVQCKNYSGNVGVDAVMQAHSGSAYYNCSSSVVVAPSGFTEAAYEMANKLGVELLVLGGCSKSAP